MMENLFYWIVTRPTFKNEVDKYILNVVDASNSEKSIKLKSLYRDETICKPKGSPVLTS